MRTVDLTPLNNNDADYQKTTDVLDERFKCQWDDDIHDSYARYVQQLQEHSREVHTIRCKAESLLKEAESLKVDEKRKTAEYLCKEADSV